MYKTLYKAINRFNNIKEIRKVCSQCRPVLEGQELKMTFSKIDSLKQKHTGEDDAEMTAFNAISAELTTICTVFKSWCNF